MHNSINNDTDDKEYNAHSGDEEDPGDEQDEEDPGDGQDEEDEEDPGDEQDEEYPGDEQDEDIDPSSQKKVPSKIDKVKDMAGKAVNQAKPIAQKIVDANLDSEGFKGQLESVEKLGDTDESRKKRKLNADISDLNGEHAVVLDLIDIIWEKNNPSLKFLETVVKSFFKLFGDVEKQTISNLGYIACFTLIQNLKPSERISIDINARVKENKGRRITFDEFENDFSLEIIKPQNAS